MIGLALIASHIVAAVLGFYLGAYLYGGEM